MPKRTRTAAKPDVVQNARRVVLESTGQAKPISLSVVSQVMSEMGRKGGLIGGKRRLVTMTEERRKQVASDAAKARWAKVKAAAAKSTRKKTA
jgi:hypothetical protein